MEAGEDISGIEKKDDPVRLSDWVDPKDVREGRVRVYSPSGREASAEEYENDPERPACIRERVEGIQERLQKKLAALKLQKQKEAKDDKKGN